MFDIIEKLGWNLSSFLLAGSHYFEEKFKYVKIKRLREWEINELMTRQIAITTRILFMSLSICPWTEPYQWPYSGSWYSTNRISESASFTNYKFRFLTSRWETTSCLWIHGLDNPTQCPAAETMWHV